MTDARDDTVTVNHAVTIALFFSQEATDETIRILEAIQKHGAGLVLPIVLPKLRAKSKFLAKEINLSLAEREAIAREAANAGGR